MKRIHNLLLRLTVVITVAFSACHQNKNTKIVKVEKTEKVEKALRKNDTLIFRDTALSALVKQTDRYFNIFDTISPMNNGYDLSKLKLNKAELKSLYTSANDSTSTTIMNGSEITTVLSGWIQSNLMEILGWKNINNYDLRLLLKNHLGIANSPDNKLYCFSFDEKTG